MKKLFDDFESAIAAEPDLNQALELARLYGNILWFADVGIYDAPSIEKSLIDRCAQFYQNYPVVISEDKKLFLHVISEPFMTGGHTRLMEKLAAMHEKPVDLLISRSASQRAEEYVAKFFSNTLKITSGQPLDIIVELVNTLSSYSKIVLHIHPDDILTVVACGVVKRLQHKEIFFVNHADHVFSYGTSIADYYFELSSYGKRLDSLKSISGRKSFLGIPIKISQEKKADLDFNPVKTQELLFISAGSDIKYKPQKKYNIFKLVSRILNDYPSSGFLIIGSNIKSSFWWWPLKAKYGRRLEVRAHLDFEEYNKLVQKADFYVDSHPIPGGTAFAEQFVGGRRCVGLISPIQGYSPADKLKRHNIEEVLHSIAEYKHSNAVFEAIVEINSFESVKKRYLKCVMEGQVCENLLDLSNDWTGNIEFFRSSRGRLDADVSVASFFLLYKIKRVFAFRLFVVLSLSKKLKLLMKIFVFRFF